MKKNLIEWSFAIFIGVMIAIIIQSFVFTRYTVSGNSMYPTFKNNDQVIVTKISKNMNTIHRGDVIIFHADKSHDYIKRLIGMPGDTIKYKNDSLYVNNKKIKEPYLNYNKKANNHNQLTENFNISNIKGSHQHKVIPNNKYLVLGDNRLISNDSRGDVGLLSEEKIVGKAKIRIFPLSRFKYSFYESTFDEINN